MNYTLKFSIIDPYHPIVDDEVGGDPGAVCIIEEEDETPRIFAVEIFLIPHRCCVGMVLFEEVHVA